MDNSELQMSVPFTNVDINCDLKVLWFLMVFFTFPDLKNKKLTNILIYFHSLTSTQAGP